MAQSSIHSPLDSNRHQIRLLVLQRGHEDEPIHCTLRTCCLIGALPSFEALSYVWGDAALTTPIYVGSLRTRFDATTNLACALSHLRYRDRDRVLWVDALCINQGDNDEKSHQVWMMKKIYEGAERVLAWLGPASPGAENAIQTLKLLAKDPDLHWTPDGRSNRSGPSITLEQALGIHAWYQNCDWWTRIWTVQEYTVAKDLAFLCGHHSILKTTTERLAQNYFKHAECCPSPNMPAADGQGFIEVVTGVIFNETHQLEILISGENIISPLQLVTLFRVRKATRPEDKVYGLMGLANDFDEHFINYGITVGLVYEDFAKLIIKNSGNLDVLTHVVHPYSIPLEPLDASNEAVLPTRTHDVFALSLFLLVIVHKFATSSQNFQFQPLSQPGNLTSKRTFYS